MRVVTGIAPSLVAASWLRRNCLAACDTTARQPVERSLLW
jgi:hypothetical protein